jgi:tRNA A37 threonylcarbamoyladenosine dehydratase
VIGRLCFSPLPNILPTTPQTTKTGPQSVPWPTKKPPRAFSAIDRLYGTGAYAKLHNAAVTIVGIGGVGSWAAEAIARHGIHNINIIDLDNVAVEQRTS